ncbi:MAG: Methionine synthase (cobalamin-dependent), methyltransferase [Bacteriovoracaceae bacterium]|nr:Methionine synthase (cobalamin-dependent), methyltransferase [Bacteriovoracaceae bacterium]
MHPFLEAMSQRVVLGDGAMGTMLYSKGIYINRCYDYLNLESPTLIQGIHTEYLQSGCELLETNTFGANRVRLKTHGLENQLKEINRAGIENAKKALAAYSEKTMKTAWIGGSMGPLGVNSEPFGPLKHSEAVAIFKEQAEILNEGVDIFMLETFTHLTQLRAAVEGVRAVSKKPIVAMMTVTDEGTSILLENAETMIETLNELEVEVIGLNCSNGPSAILDVLEIFRPRTKKFLATFPNAGIPKQVGGRYIYMSTPEYFGSFTKKFITVGANLIGGCCGTTPTHMKRARDSIIATRHSSSRTEIKVEEVSKAIPQVEILPAEKKSRLSAKIHSGKFAISVEIDPPKGTAFAKSLEASRQCFEAGIDCINIADGPRASARMSPMSMAVILERDIGIETIIHYCCRDRNLLGMQSDLLGANALGLKNILIITGDPPKLGDYPESASVYDVDAIGLTRIVNRLNRGMDLAGNPIGKPTSFFQGVGCNPGSLNFEEEIERLQKKIDAGAEYILTQPVYDHKTFEKFLKAYKNLSKRIPLLIGICPLASLKNAEFLHNEVPGMQIPDEILKRMARPETPDLQRAEGIKIAREALKEFKKEVQGTYIMPPFNRADIALEVVDGFIEN